jgi:hypothetical protein
VESPEQARFAAGRFAAGRAGVRRAAGGAGGGGAVGVVAGGSSGGADSRTASASDNASIKETAGREGPAMGESGAKLGGVFPLPRVDFLVVILRGLLEVGADGVPTEGDNDRARRDPAGGESGTGSSGASLSGSGLAPSGGGEET